MRRPVTKAAAAATTLTAIAYPLARRGGVVRRLVSQGVVAGLATTTAAATAHRWGSARAGAAAAVVVAATAAVERIGTATGLPFGRYRYTGRLRPVVGGVPVVVPLAWFAMAVPAREAAHAALGPASRTTTRISLGAAALTAWDLFLDPQMTAEGFWRWSLTGRYRGIPATNFLGWMLSGAAVMALLEVLLPPGRPEAALVSVYAGTAVMETLGFAAFLGDPLVAAVGGLAMLPVAALATARVVRG
jgi:putative membrane protein